MFFDIQESINGDSVIGFTSAKRLAKGGFLDSTKLVDFMSTDDGRSHHKYLGLINLFVTTEDIAVPTITNLLANAQVMEVEEGQTIRYDTPVNKMWEKATITKDCSTINGERPGIGGTLIELYLSEEFSKSEVIAYDPRHGVQLIISDDHEVETDGEGFKHYALLYGAGREDWFPLDKLKAGIQFIRVDHVLGEHDTSYGMLSAIGSSTDIIHNEFLLADARGLEFYYSAKAGRSRSIELERHVEKVRESINNRLAPIGGTESMFMIAPPAMTSSGEKVMNTKKAMIGSSLEFLLGAEMLKLEAYSLNYGKGGTVRSANGTKRGGEGLYHQRRRGKIIEYSRAHGITFNHISQALEYVYQNRTGVPMSQRKAVFTCGSGAFSNMQQLFAAEIREQLNSLSPQLIGTDMQISQKVLSGPLDALEMKSVAFKSVSIPNIGVIELKLDTSMDFDPMADRLHRGFYMNGFSHNSYTMMIEDASIQASMHIQDKVKGAKLVQDGQAYGTTYYIKPEGPHFVWGYEQGRMPDNGKYEAVLSSIKKMGKTMWITSQSSVLDTDITRQVTIELKEKF